MANKQNLKPLSTEKAREIGAKGGKASAEARRKKRDLRNAIEILLETDIKGKNGEIKVVQRQ
jgi:general stress protein YciG